MTHNDERNTLIWESTNVITSESTSWLQGQGDAFLVEAASVAIFLRDAHIRSEEELHTYSVEDQRNTLITQLHMWTDDPISELNATSSTDLLVIGCAFNSNLYLVAEVSQFEWDIDRSQVAEEVPVLLSEQLYDNCNSSIDLSATFAFNKAVTETTTFHNDNEFHMDVSAAMSFSAKIPFILKTEFDVGVSLGEHEKSW